MGMRWIWFGVAVAFASPALAQRPAERDWAAALRADARALHDEIAANHPGAVNPEDPGFAKRNDAQLAMALKRARTARTYADYYLPLREYVAAFNDGHMTIRIFGDAPSEYRWPGFLTNYDAQGKMRVHTRAGADRSGACRLRRSLGGEAGGRSDREDVGPLAARIDASALGPNALPRRA
jgi:hypothetical protein